MSKTAARWLGAIAIALLLIAGGRQDAEAELIISVAERGNDVVATWSGGILDFAGASGNDARRRGFKPSIESRSGHFTNWLGVQPFTLLTISGPTSFGTGDFVGGATITAPSDQHFRLLGEDKQLVVPTVVFGNSSVSFSGSMTFTNAQFGSGPGTDLGLTPGTYSWTFTNTSGTNNQITLNIGSIPSAIPEPTTALGLLVMVTSAFFRRRRRLLG